MIELLPARDQVRGEIQDICDTYRTDVPDKAVPKFMAHAGLAEPPSQDPTTNYRPTSKPCRPPRPASWSPVGATSKGQFAHRSALALADRLGTPQPSSPATTSVS